MKDKEMEGTFAIFVYKVFHLRNISRKEKAELETIYATYSTSECEFLEFL